jgi:putative Holliday junction resolvase
VVVLAVDYGDTRTGLAKCDREELLASPHMVITERNASKLAEKITQEAEILGAEQIVVGNPLNMDGSAGSRSEKCVDFSKLLEETSGIPVVTYDERSTTVSATYYLNQTDVRGAKRKKIIDAVAAMIILESYLAFKKRKGL